MIRDMITQRIEESPPLRMALLGAYGLMGGVLRIVGKHETAWKLLAQVHRTTRTKALQDLVEPFLIRNLEVACRRTADPDLQMLREMLGVRILVLKRKQSAAEKGVVLVKFSETIKEFARGVDLRRLLQDYWLVLEPSWSGYCDPDLLTYSQFDEPVFVMAAETDDFRFLEALRSNLVPLPFGPSDWVDPDIAAPFLGRPKKYDIVFNSNWRRLKRHYVLFSALAEIDRDLQVALIGGSVGDGRTIDDIRRIATYHGVLDQLTFFEHIPYEDVMRINCESRLAILLSLKEGSNRAIAESFFCDVPGIVLEEHVGGIRKNIVPETGRLVPERELPQAIMDMLDNPDDFDPRAWAVENISCHATSAALNDAVRSTALAAGGDWTKDIAAKSNSPELRIVDSDAREALREYHDRLEAYLLPE